MESNTNFFLRFFRSKAFIGILLLIVFGLAFNLFVQFSQYQGVKNNVDQLKNEISQIEKENSNLSDLINYFNSDLFVEKEARTKLGLVKKGEAVMMVEDSPDNLSEKENFAQEEKKVNQPKNYNPKLWWDYFFVNKQ